MDPAGRQGAVYSTIDGVGGPYPLAEVDNASRVIKYVVTFGYRFQSYNLVDLRIHDVNVVADLNRQAPDNPNPTEPVEQDGTGTGTLESIEPIAESQMLIDSAMSIAQQVLIWWEGWWPRLHVSVTFATPMGGTATFHCSVDLLMSFHVVELSVDTPVDDGLTQEQSQEYTALVLHALQEESSTGWGMLYTAMTWGVISLIAACLFLLAIPASLVDIPLLLGLMLVGWLEWVRCIIIGLYLRLISWEFVFGLLNIWLELLAFPVNLVGVFVFALVICRVFGLSELLDAAKTAIKWAILTAAVGFLMALGTFFLFAYIYEKTMDEFRRQHA